MFDRKLYKEEAKSFLKKHYWKAFIVTLILGLLVGGRGRAVTSGVDQLPLDGYYKEYGYESALEDSYYEFKEEVRNIGPFMKVALAGLGAFAIIFSIVASIISTIIDVGGAKFFVEGIRGDANIGYLGFPFGGARLWSVFITQFLVKFYTFLWTLLFIIPGIIKSYEYSMVKYIKADNPELNTKESIALSKKLTHGHKMDLFVLDLSFIGWLLLGGMACVVGVLFVTPYIHSTWAVAYNKLRANYEGKEIGGMTAEAF